MALHRDLSPNSIFLDSGTRAHLFRSEKELSNIKPTAIKLTGINGTSMINHEGVYKGQKALIAPKANSNLTSIGALEDSNFATICLKNKAYILRNYDEV